MRRLVILLVVVVIATACDSDLPLATTTDRPPEDTITTLRDVPPTTAPPATTTSNPGITTTIGREIDVQIAGGEVEGPEVFEVTLGEIVDIWILSDVDDEIHVHGYDLRFDLDAAAPFHLTFEADVPGIFEVETHDLQQPLLEIEVTG
jgi:hypothetical protein